jgi:HK97 family phage prohead protease
MPKKEGREYRSFSASSFRALDEQDSYIVEGYATTFDEPYDFGFDGAKECIARNALDGADMSDVIFQYDHEGRVLARQRNNTLSVMCDEHGLYVRADLGGSEQGRQLYEEIRNGLVDRMSWAFIIDEGGWEYDRATRTSTITKVAKVFDVSAVSIPANEDTEIHARSYFDGVIEMEQQELLQREKESESRRRYAAALSMAKVKG